MLGLRRRSDKTGSHEYFPPAVPAESTTPALRIWRNEIEKPIPWFSEILPNVRLGYKILEIHSNHISGDLCQTLSAQTLILVACRSHQFV